MRYTLCLCPFFYLCEPCLIHYLQLVVQFHTVYSETVIRYSLGSGILLLFQLILFSQPRGNIELLYLTSRLLLLFRINFSHPIIVPNTDFHHFYPFLIPMGAPVFVILCGISIVAGVTPLLWHIKSRNTPAICLIIWLTIFNIFSFINAFIWGGRNIFTAWDGAIYCDIQVKILIAASAGKMGSVAAISRNLAKIMSDEGQVMVRTKSMKRRMLIQDLLLCFGVPVWMMSVHYIVQPNRYYLFGITGCTPSVDNSWPTVVLLFIWPPIVAIISGYYAVLVLLRLHRYRKEFSAILNSSQSNVTKSRFLRLYAFSFILVLVFLPVTFYIFYRNLSVRRIPYSWRLVHGVEWEYILRIPTDGMVAFDKWIAMGAGYILFLFFGMGSDAIGMYRGWLRVIGFHWLVGPDRSTSNGSNGSASRATGSDGSSRTRFGSHQGSGTRSIARTETAWYVLYISYSSNSTISSLTHDSSDATILKQKQKNKYFHHKGGAHSTHIEGRPTNPWVQQQSRNPSKQSPMLSNPIATYPSLEPEEDDSDRLYYSTIEGYNSRSIAIPVFPQPPRAARREMSVQYGQSGSRRSVDIEEEIEWVEGIRVERDFEVDIKGCGRG